MKISTINDNQAMFRLLKYIIRGAWMSLWHQQKLRLKNVVLCLVINNGPRMLKVTVTLGPGLAYVAGSTFLSLKEDLEGLFRLKTPLPMLHDAVSDTTQYMLTFDLNPLMSVQTPSHIQQML